MIPRSTVALVWLVFLLCWPVDVSAQITLVSGQSVATQANDLYITGSLDHTENFPAAVTSNNTVVAWPIWGTNTRTMSCTHDGNAMTAVTTPNATANAMVQVFARVATTAGTGVTCTISANDTQSPHGLVIAEFAGMPTTLSTQGGAGVTTTGAVETTTVTSHDSGADLTPDTTDNLFVGAIRCTTAAGTWGNDGFTNLLSATQSNVSYLIQAAATAGDWVPTTSNSVTCEVVAQNLDGSTSGGGWPLGSQ